MKNLIYLLIVFSLSSSCDNTPVKNIKEKQSINDIENTGIIPVDRKSNQLMINSGSIKAAEEIKLYGRDFSIVLDDSRDTIHWSTKDKNFKTPEGYKVGTNWNHIPRGLQKNVKRMPGWGYYITLNSGWQLGFCEGQSCTDTEPKDGSIVKWIFKRG